MVRSYQTGSKPHIFLWICSTILDGRWLGDSSTTTLLFNSIIAMHFLEKSDFFYFCLSFNFFVFFPFFLFFPFPLLSTCFYLYLLSFANFIFFVYFCLFLSIFIYFSSNFTVLFQMQQFPNHMSSWTEFIREIFVKQQKPNKNMWIFNKKLHNLCLF